MVGPTRCRVRGRQCGAERIGGIWGGRWRPGLRWGGGGQAQDENEANTNAGMALQDKLLKLQETGGATVLCKLGKRGFRENVGDVQRFISTNGYRSQTTYTE